MPPKVMVSSPGEEGPTPGPDLSFLRPHKSFWENEASSSPPRTSVDQHSRSTSNMNDPRTNVDQVRPARTPRAHPLPETSTPTSPRGEDASYVDNRDIITTKKSNLKDSYVKANLGDKNNKSNLDVTVTTNNPKVKRKRKSNPSTNQDSAKDNLVPLGYSQLKKLCAIPPSTVQYGPDTLLTATTRANFERMHLSQLQHLPREKIAEEYHAILDQTIDRKRLAMNDELDDIAFDLYVEDSGYRLDNTEELEYPGGRVVQRPPQRRRYEH